MDTKMEPSTTSEAVENACKARNISLNGINLKELFNEDTFSPKKTKIVSNESNNSNDSEIVEEASSRSTFNEKEEAQFVSIYHSYASKPIQDTDDSTTLSSIQDALSAKPNNNDSTVAEIEKLELNLLSPSSSSSNDLETKTPTSKSDLPLSSASNNNDADANNDDDLLDEDYFEDGGDDYDDDELTKIRQKYNMMRQEEVYGDDFEDCGF